MLAVLDTADSPSTFSAADVDPHVVHVMFAVLEPAKLPSKSACADIALVGFRV